MLLAQAASETAPALELQNPSWWIETGRELVATYGLRILAGLAVLIVGWVVARILTAVTRRMMAKARVEPTLAGFTGNMIYMALMALVVISAFGAAGFPTTSFIAVIGAAGLAVGFALQGSLANFAAGVMLILFRPIKVGDYIEAGGVAGSVESIQVFATTLKTPDNKLVIVPNSGITGGNITNYSAKDTRRVDMVFGIAYGDDIGRAKDTLKRVLQQDVRVLADPAPTIGVVALGESSVNLAVRPWVRTADYWDVYFALNENVKRAFDADGITIPFPQRDIHMQPVLPAA